MDENLLIGARELIIKFRLFVRSIRVNIRLATHLSSVQWLSTLCYYDMTKKALHFSRVYCDFHFHILFILFEKHALFFEI
jgi:hypothetical protein